MDEAIKVGDEDMSAPNPDRWVSSSHVIEERESL
jgi:hypothetical protein